MSGGLPYGAGRPAARCSPDSSAELDVLVESRGAGPAVRQSSAGGVGGRRRPRRHLRQGSTSRPAPPSSSKTTAAAPSARCSRPCAPPAARSIYVLGTSPEDAQQAPRRCATTFPKSPGSRWPSWPGRRCSPSSGRSVTRQKVQQYQRYLSDADRVLILTHNDPDPDAIASGLALRNLLRRTRQTAIIGCMQRRDPAREPAHAEAARPARSRC